MLVLQNKQERIMRPVIQRCEEVCPENGMSSELLLTAAVSTQIQ